RRRSRCSKHDRVRLRSSALPDRAPRPARCPAPLSARPLSGTDLSGDDRSTARVATVRLVHTGPKTVRRAASLTAAQVVPDESSHVPVFVAYEFFATLLPYDDLTRRLIGSSTALVLHHAVELGEVAELPPAEVAACDHDAAFVNHLDLGLR